MSLTKNLNTTGQAAVIEKRDFQDSTTPREPRSVADEIATLKIVRDILFTNAEEYPQFSTSLFEKAYETQSRINALEAQEQAAENRRILEWLEDEQDDNYPMAMGR